jgi:hypothetical protein
MTNATAQAPAAAVIERRHRLSYDEFRRDFLIPRRPVIITGALDEWPASRWTPATLREKYGASTVHIKDQPTTLGEYLDRVERSSVEDPVPYLRDQILKDVHPDIVADVTPFHPYIFPNWLRGRYLPKPVSYQLNRPSNVELFIGGLGTKLGELHYDFAHCHVALAQLYGRKQFWVYPPEQSQFLYATGIKDVEHPDLEKYPLFAKAVATTFVQEPGEIVVLPTGWWHTTRLLGTSIAVAINFANDTNWSDVVDDVCQELIMRRPLIGRTYRAWLQLRGLGKRLGGRNVGRATLFR